MSQNTQQQVLQDKCKFWSMWFSEFVEIFYYNNNNENLLLANYKINYYTQILIQ